MDIVPEKLPIYHITDVANLPGILVEDGLHSDAAMAARDPTVIGYNHIKKRRLREITVPCCGNRFVGQFVPFYFCPRSPMLYTINRGNTGRPPGCQRTILHLVSTLAVGIAINRPWAVSDGNAGSFYATFDNQTLAIATLDWDAIGATDWRGKTHQKSAEFLVAYFFPWSGIRQIGCQNSTVAREIADVLRKHAHCPAVEVKPEWYY